MLDLLIVGAGPAGLAAAIQARRDGLEAQVVSDERPGGLVRAAHRLDNLPGYPGGISGGTFADRLEKQALQWNVRILEEKITCIRSEGGDFTSAGSGQYRSRTIILACGTLPLKWDCGIPPACGPRIHRDARSFPDSMKGLEAAVIGGGEAAFDTALSAADRGARVTVHARSARAKAPERLLAEVNLAGVTVAFRHEIREVKETGGRFRLVWRTPEGPETTAADHIAVCIGREPSAGLFSSITGGAALPCDIHCGVPGLFLAGDLIRGRDRYVATAMGDGQRAALAALKHLKNRRDR
jgi:thioredoxin reductase (NADPH)